MSKPKAAKKSAEKPKTPAAPSEPLAVELEGSEKAYRDHLAEANALEARDVEVCRLDVHLAYHNMALGVEAVLTQSARFGELPNLDFVRLGRLPDLALGVIFAAAQVDPNPASTSDVRKLLARARVLRRVLRTAARALTNAGVFPAAPVARIEKGRGDLDAAQDCVDYASLFVKHAADVRGKTAVTAAQVKEAAAVGSELLTKLRPRAAGKTKVRPADVKAAADVRDRLFTLFMRDWHNLWRAGAYFFGRNGADERVPWIQLRVVGKTTPKLPSKSGQVSGVGVSPPGVVGPGLPAIPHGTPGLPPEPLPPG